MSEAVHTFLRAKSCPDQPVGMYAPPGQRRGVGSGCASAQAIARLARSGQAERPSDPFVAHPIDLAGRSIMSGLLGAHGVTVIGQTRRPLKGNARCPNCLYGLGSGYTAA